MTRTMTAIVAIGVAQAAFLGIYWLVEKERPHASATEALSTAPPERVRGNLKPLSLRTRDGTPLVLNQQGSITLLHFWATWCPPCRAELPSILALPDEHGIDVMAVALDEEWSQVDRFLDGRSSDRVVLGSSAQIERALGIRTLPVTYLVAPGGRLLLRFAGARNWTDQAFLDTWLEAAAKP